MFLGNSINDIESTLNNIEVSFPEKRCDVIHLKKNIGNINTVYFFKPGYYFEVYNDYYIAQSEFLTMMWKEEDAFLLETPKGGYVFSYRKY